MALRVPIIASAIGGLAEIIENERTGLLVPPADSAALAHAMGRVMGGQVGAAGHLTVGKNTMVAAQSGIPHDVPANSVIGGYPAVDIHAWRRYSAALPKLPDLLRRVRQLERALNAKKEG